MIRNIIWDVDGTLFDTYPAITRAFLAALNNLGVEASFEQVQSLAKISLGHCVSSLAENYYLDKNVLGNKFNAYYDLASPAEQPPFPGVTILCEHICSMGGSNVIVTHRGRRGLSELLLAHKMESYFSGALTRDDGYPKKPNPAAFNAILEIHQLKREETLTVGDRDIDIQAGQAAGVTTCYFGDQTEGITADLTIQDFAELQRYILAHNAPVNDQ